MRLIGYDSDSVAELEKIIPVKSRVKKIIRIHRINGGICQLCMVYCKIENATIDHILPKSLGGSRDMSNLQLAHKWCNWIKGNDNVIHPYEYYLNHNLYDPKKEISKKHKGKFY